jgi:2-methylcitrate dehydratase PrpD
MRQLSMKPWCAAKQTIAAIDGFRQIVHGRDPEAIAAVRVAVPPPYRDMVGHRNCGGRVGRITSLSYQLALAALRPEALVEVARRDHSADPGIAAVMALVAVEADPDLLDHFPASWPARVEVAFRGGGRETILVTQAEGDPERPLDAAAVAAKFVALAAPVVGQADAEQWLADARAALDQPTALRALLARLDAVARRSRNAASPSDQRPGSFAR